MTNDYKTVFDFCVGCGYSEEIIKENLSDDGKVWDGYFICNSNNLTSLQGCPEKIKGFFDCSGNSLTNLKGTPKFINGDIYL